MSNVPIVWSKSELRSFNGCVETTIFKGKEYGIFDEQYSYHGNHWGTRDRPVNSNGKATDSWGHANYHQTKKEAIAFVEGIINGKQTATNSSVTECANMYV